MTKSRALNSDNEKRILKRRSCSVGKHTSQVSQENVVPPQKKSHRVVKKKVQAQLEMTCTSKKGKSSPQQRYKPCLQCKQLEAEVERLRNELNNVKRLREKTVSTAEIIEKVKELESKVSSLETPKVSALCAIEMESGDRLNNGIKIEIKDDKINLGQNFFCSLASWKVMNRTDRMPEWFVAILRGTFGEDAKNYRVNPRSETNKAFDPNFLEVAEGHFCKFLDRRMSELKGKADDFSLHLLNFFESNREKLIKQLPASLSDRAYDMYRGRFQAQKNKLLGGKTKRNLRQPRSESNKSSFRKMVTQPKLIKGLETLYEGSSSPEGSDEEELI